MSKGKDVDGEKEVHCHTDEDEKSGAIRFAFGSQCMRGRGISRLKHFHVGGNAKPEKKRTLNRKKVSLRQHDNDLRSEC